MILMTLMMTMLTKLKMLGFVDDLKAIVSTKEEFFMLDKALSVFEKASGSRLHRDPTTKKCEILPLGKWSRWTQADSPLPFMSIVDQLISWVSFLLALQPKLGLPTVNPWCLKSRAPSEATKLAVIPLSSADLTP